MLNIFSIVKSIFYKPPRAYARGILSAKPSTRCACPDPSFHKEDSGKSSALSVIVKTLYKQTDESPPPTPSDK